ncbi:MULTISPECIES: NAD-dependent epimerase [unclassified Apibacter]|uniref:NAD-dependent epimerase n=1 Tax=unclassified Apibacter TaxID=2630820 RepID=UPI00135EC643|nr:MULTISPECIES: NAD-dependent epimerase [unclassified Apibacter]MXP05776.1 NAD-dependent epimerase/dehydratase family protein [Apibacter sp. B3546]MXP11816.1 NAD-dependent epimerase/dehydratase family protein [Apibacter sp. B3239]
MKILVTGIAGFIGYHLVMSLINRDDEIIGLDSINDYYDVSIKYGRLKNCGFDKSDIEYNKLIKSSKYSNLSFIKLGLEDKNNLENLFKEEKFDKVINLAAQAGVRYSLVNPQAYIDSNITGFLTILECCRNFSIKHLTYASSSSVYGLNEKQPFSTKDNVDHPVSLYASSKKCNELMAHTYSHLFKIPTTGLRFFTVYGPWGRPDMALFIFTKSILENKPIDVYNYGKMQRDFTYISDIVQGIIKVNDNPPIGNSNWDPVNPDPSSSSAPYKIYNIGNSKPVELMSFVKTIEEELGKKAIINLLPIQPGDVPATYADVTDLIENFNYKPQVSVKEGIKNFIEWYRNFYSI